MNTTLIQNVNNGFYRQRNALTGRNGEITALVEDYVDEYLWHAILSVSCPGRRFRMVPYQEGENLSQSKSLIANEIVTKGGNMYIGCLDADQSYLLRNYGDPLGQQLENNKYLFHTYGYSRENLLCYPSTLELVFSAASSLQASFSFEDFFRDFSNIIYPVFMLDLFMRSIGSKDVLNVSKWKYILPGEKNLRAWVRQNNFPAILADVQKKASTFKKQLTNGAGYDDSAFHQFENEVLSQNSYMNKDNCCLYVYGHEFIEFVIVLLDAIRNEILNIEIGRINAQTSKTDQIKQDKIKHLQNVQKDFETVLKFNIGFIHQNTQIFQLISADTAVL